MGPSGRALTGIYIPGDIVKVDTFVSERQLSELIAPDEKDSIRSVDYSISLPRLMRLIFVCGLGTTSVPSSARGFYFSDFRARSSSCSRT